MAAQTKIEASHDGKVKIVNRNVVKNSAGHLIAMGRNMQVAIVDAKGLERAAHRITYGARLMVDEGQSIKRGDRIAEWNPNSLPILTEVDGVVRYEDIVENQRICYAMTVLRGKERLTTSMVTVEIASLGARTALTVTDQLVILVDQDTAEGRERGWGETLDKLPAEIARQAA